MDYMDPDVLCPQKADKLKGGLFDNIHHLWHRFSEQINLANVHSPEI